MVENLNNKIRNKKQDPQNSGLRTLDSVNTARVNQQVPDRVVNTGSARRTKGGRAPGDPDPRARVAERGVRSPPPWEILFYPPPSGGGTSIIAAFKIQRLFLYGLQLSLDLAKHTTIVHVDLARSSS